MALEHTTIGRYEIQRVLGRGAMGVVYLALDPHLKRQLAIKVVLNSGEEQEITLKRFRREAEISARLNHPNIVTIFDVGEDPQAGPFLAMEYVEGVPLTQLIRAGLAPETAMHLLIQGMAALEAAAAQGIVHRDIKPDNILVSREGRFKLMDFGIARRSDSHLTQAGMIFGTPAYTAPELLVGGEATPASDRYAFAVTAFEMLTGMVPFQGSSLANTLYRIVNDPPDLPEGLPAPLARTFRKALAKEPDKRHGDLAAFLGELLEALDLAPEDRQSLRTQLEGSRTGGLRTGFLPAALENSDRPTARSAPMPDGRATTARRPRALLAWLRGILPSTLRWRPRTLWALGALLLCVCGAGLLLALRPVPGRRVDILSTPTGAHVLLDGRYLGQTPLSQVRVKGEGGILRLELPGHRSVTRPLAPREWSVHVVLQKPPYRIPVISEPPGALASLNGRPVGTTPIPALDVPREGAQELRLNLPGYQTWTALLDENFPFPSPVILSPGGGSVRVVTRPAGAEILLDGVPMGQTPADCLELPGRGSHRLVLRLEGFEPWQGRVDGRTALPDPIQLKPAAGGRR